MKFWDQVKAFRQKLRDKLYEDGIGYLSKGIYILIGFGLLLLIGFQVKGCMDRRGDLSQNYTKRQLRGRVVSARDSLPLAEVFASVPGELGDSTRTDTDGLFTLRFTLHRDSHYTKLLLYKASYRNRNVENQPVPLNAAAEKHTVDFVLYPE